MPISTLSLSSPKRSLRKVILTSIICLLFADTYATNYTVTNFTDGNATNQLRGALIAASNGANTVTLLAGNYILTQGQIFFANANSNITIVGAGAGSTTISMATGANQDRIFAPNYDFGVNVTISISGITFANGLLRSDPYGGGAILFTGARNLVVNITNCAFTNNGISAASGGTQGGAVCLSGAGTLNVSGCTFSNNTAQNAGAIDFAAYSYNDPNTGLYYYGNCTLSVTNSVFTNNSASAGSGGAIHVSSQGWSSTDQPTPPVISINILRNIFTGNSSATANGGGGAVSTVNSFSNAASANFHINYNRFSGNTVSGNTRGSALYMADVQGNVDASNNWWGCNSGGTSCADYAYRVTGSSPGQLITTPYLQLKTTAPGTGCTGTGKTITSGFTSNSAGSTIAAADLAGMVGAGISFTAANGTLSSAQTTIQSNGNATVVFTPTGGTPATINPVVDNVPSNDATAKGTFSGINAGTNISSHPGSVSVCAGSNTSLSVSATGSGTISYQWRRGTTNLTNTAPYSNVTAATLNITGAAAAQAGSDYNVVVTSSTCGSITSNNGSVAVTALGTWLGGSNANWSNTANWSCGTLPTSAMDVTIPSGTTFQPTIDIATAAANNISLAAGTILNFSGAASALSLYGSISGAGVFNATTGKVIFAGGTQNIPAVGYNDIQINGAGNKTLTGTIGIKGVLTLTNGLVLTGNNFLTILSTGSISGGSAASYIVTNGTGSLVQQFIGPGGRTGTILFPVGSSASSYTPVSLSNSGSITTFAISMLSALYSAYNTSGVPTGAAATALAVGRTWVITPSTPGTAIADITLQWNAADELPAFIRSACTVSHYGSTGWAPLAPLAAASGVNPYTRSVSGVTDFSPFGVGSFGSVLPLHLLSFTGSAAGGANKLQWITAEENSLSHFSIEKSSDGQHFSEIGTVASNGNGNGNNTYNFTDDAITSLDYYRLKMVNDDGTYTFSNTLIIKNTISLLTVSPNPFADNFTINITSGKSTDAFLTLSDVSGRIVLRSTLHLQRGNNTIRYDQLGQLSKGVYFLKVKNNDFAETFRLTKLD